MKRVTHHARGAMPVVALALTVLAPMALGQTEFHARVSFASGNGMIKGSADADWSFATVNTLVLPGDTLWVDQTGMLELETSGGSFVRMVDGSKVDVAALPPSGAFRGWQGSFYIQRVTRSMGDIVFSTPAADIAVDPDSEVRVDIAADGATTVSVHWGHATVSSQGSPGVELAKDQRCYVNSGLLPSEATSFDARTEDGFDTWNRERAQLLAVGDEAVPQSIVAQQTPTPCGMDDLATYGQWVTVDNTPYWQPLVADYVPYRYGHWSFVPAYGYCWVDNYPFAYATSHYGRWTHHAGHGWLWTYRDTWGPAWVASFHYGPDFVWSPLDPFNRPVVYGNEYFSVGGLHVGIGASSYCVADRLLMYGGPMVVVAPLTPAFVREVPVSEVSLWDISGGGHYHARYDRIYGAFKLPVKDFRPQHFLRGPEQLSLAGGRTEIARARVEKLQSSTGRKEFRMAGAASRPGGRTPVNPASAKLRKVNIAPTATESLQARVRAASAKSAETKKEILKTAPVYDRTERTTAPTTGKAGPTGKPGIAARARTPLPEGAKPVAGGPHISERAHVQGTRGPGITMEKRTTTPPGVTRNRTSVKTRTTIPEGGRVGTGGSKRITESPLNKDAVSHFRTLMEETPTSHGTTFREGHSTAPSPKLEQHNGRARSLGPQQEGNKRTISSYENHAKDKVSPLDKRKATSEHERSQHIEHEKRDDSASH